MPKMKTNKSVAKRIQMTGTGKIKIKKQGLRHILGGKSSSTKRARRKAGILSETDRGHVERCLPYGALK